ncbi:hypothetical protein PFISCL1PPCAC_4908 [Pristionchus fissidentatus]|uniref:Major facilitator superfamily (MFS) profile domain-containing protein n=1 Tax=Pristionchus fissidentatus TaxID=1538716 RepID=A0AAV5V4E1_9BILA|nr:hypothetical protein PFISCL1PPCAC_4908 [Pristionchus fissidentatus]
MSFSSSSVSSLRARTMSSSDDGITVKQRAVKGCCAPAGNKVKLLLVCGVLSCATNFPEGYCNSYPNTSHQTFQDQINASYIARGVEGGLSDEVFTWYWSGMLNVWFIGYLIGTFLTPYFCDNLGRKKALFIANCIALLGAILSFIGVVFNVPEVFFASRIIASISSGVSFGSLILFLQEATPTELRGVTSFLSESTFIMTMGMGIGFGMDAVFGKNLPVLTGIAIFPAIVAIIVVIPLHETPKFLLINRDNKEAAMESLEYYRGITSENDEVLDDMMLEKQVSASGEDVKPFVAEYGLMRYTITIWQGVKEVLSQGHLRISFFLGAAALQIIVGIWPIVYLSTDLLEDNFSPEISQIASFAFMMSDFLASILGLFIIERFGRRTLLIWLGIANTLSLCLYMISDLLIPVWDPIRWGQIAALILFGATYGIALGPIAYFITSELVPQRSRSIVQSMVLGFNTTMNFILSFITLPCYNYFGVLSFLPLLVVPSICCIIFLYFFLPETRGREVHDVVEELMARHNKDALKNKERNISISVLSASSLTSVGSIEKKNTDLDV